MMQDTKTGGAERQPETIPYIVYEGAVMRHERLVKRLLVALIVTIVLLFGSNMAWLIYESQYETFYYEQDGAGLNNINTGTQGDVIPYGTESEIQEEEGGQQ